MSDDRPAIAHVLHRLDRAGAEVLAGELARGLSERFRFVFFCLDAGGPLADELADEGFAVEVFDRRPGVDRAAVRRLAEAIRSHKVRLLHAHQYTPFFYASASRRARRQPPVLFTEHGRHYPDRPRLKRRLLRPLLLRRDDRVTAVSGFVKDMLVENEGINADRVEVIHNGIDPQRFRSDRGTRAATRNELGLREGDLAVLQIARFHPVKDHATALRAFAQVHPRTTHARLLLAGDGEEKHAMESLATELGISEHVRFLGVRSDIPTLLVAADVFLISSLSEGLSVTLLEAMAAGLPIVATDVGGNPEVVEHGKTGLLAPRGDADALAKHLVALLQNESQRRAMGEAGLQRVTAKFTQDRMHQAFATHYEAMLPRA